MVSFVVYRRSEVDLQHLRRGADLESVGQDGEVFGSIGRLYRTEGLEIPAARLPCKVVKVPCGDRIEPQFADTCLLLCDESMACLSLDSTLVQHALHLYRI